MGIMFKTDILILRLQRIVEDLMKWHFSIQHIRLE